MGFNYTGYVYNVNSFKEKPDYQTAKEYIAKGSYLWNCGYFVGTIGTFIHSMEKYSPILFNNYELLKNSSPKSYQEKYLSFESEAIDYALIEKITNLLVIPASFDWMDLGSYSDLHKATGSDQSGNHIKGEVEIEGVENSFIENFENKPVAVIGLDNVVVINSPSGILVTRKDLSQKVGEVSKRIEK